MIYFSMTITRPSREKLSIPFSGKRILTMILLIAAGIFIFYPTLDFQNLLSQGDHGRDLYAFKKTLDGALPYRDYWWVYGPLMPFYYAFFFKVFGIYIPSVLIGKMFLNLTAGVFFFLSISLFSSSLFAFVATLWFWTYNPDFFFTYNHAGGIAASLGVIYCALRYIHSPRRPFFILGLAGIWILSFIKINIGIFTLASFMTAIMMTDIFNKDFKNSKKIFYFWSCALLLVSIIFIYWLLIKDLPFYDIRQCFPYLRSDHPYYSPLGNSLVIIGNWFIRVLTSSWGNFCIGSLIFFSFIQTILKLKNKEGDHETRSRFLLSSVFLIVFCVLNLHEFMDSAVYYRAFWAAPAKFLLFFMVIAFATKQFPLFLRYLLLAVLSCVILFQNQGQYQSIQSFKNGSRYLSMQTGRIFVGNHPLWVETVKKTTDFLEEHLSGRETFFALPYDPLYYYLTGKDSPTRQLIFFDHILINETQEKDVIRSLEEKKVNYIVLSSRQNAKEEGLGTFGKTYCRTLADYIFKNFEVVAAFGDWQDEPGWAWNHGMKILQRIHHKSLIIP